MSTQNKPAPKPTAVTQKTSAAETLFNAPVARLTTPTQDAAIDLYELRFNVIPIPFAKKGGWPWKPFQYVRVHPDHLLKLFAGRCNLAIMTGRTSHNLFVIDCETPESYRLQGTELRRAGIPLWSVRTGGGGGHYYLRCVEGEVANVLPGELHDVEVRGQRCYVLAPPSVHPTTGAVYDWDQREGDLPPLVRITDIDWLPLKLATHAKRDAQRIPTAFPELSTSTRNFILNGTTEGERNNRLFAAACDMAGNDYDDYTVRQVLIPIALKCGLPENEVRDTLRSAFSQPRQPARQAPLLHQEPKPWEKALCWAAQHAWQGRTGQTDRAVFLACCERARRASNENGVFRASVREIAEIARITAKTASTALRRLHKATLLEYKGSDTTSQAKLWKLGQETTKGHQTAQKVRDDYTNPPWLSSSVVITNSDAAERGALGKTAAVVYEGLLGQAGPIMPTPLAERLKLSRVQVQHALAKLKGYNLVRREKAGWVGIGVSSEWLDKNVAGPAGTLGRGEVRKQQHIEQRARRAGERILQVRIAESRAKEEVCLDELLGGEHAQRSTCGVLFCQNCGQSIFVFEGTRPPHVCAFCAQNYGWKKGTVWLPGAPKPPTREDRRKGSSP